MGGYSEKKRQVELNIGYHLIKEAEVTHENLSFFFIINFGIRFPLLLVKVLANMAI